MKKNRIVGCFLALSSLVAMPSTLAGQDTAMVAKPSLSPKFQLYLINPNSVLLLQPKTITLDFEVDPLLVSAQYSDDIYIRQLMAVDNMGQSISKGLQKEQRDMQVLGILNMVATGFVWGMIIKENIEGYYDYKAQQKNQPQQRPERPPEVRRP